MQESIEFARRCYLAAAPGERAAPSSGLLDRAEGLQPNGSVALLRLSFAVLLVTVNEIDWYCRALLRGDSE